MGKVKYYAVRVGKVPGIYKSWEECKSMIDGYSNAEYKAFGSREEANAYVNNIDIVDRHKVVAHKTNTVIAYVDGSYSDLSKRYSYGCVLITPTGEVMKKSGSGNDSRGLKIRNIAGELQGAMYAVKLALELGYSKIIIRHDYVGISKWYSGEWKAKDEIAKTYVEYLTRLANRIKITFEKVTAHSGDKFNDIADQLAKAALEKVDKAVDESMKASLDKAEREKLINIINENIMESREVIEYLEISNQKLTSLIKSGKISTLKKGIYLRIDVENLKYELK